MSRHTLGVMPDVDPDILFLYRSLDLGGVVLMGIMGGTIARQRNFDVIGFIFLALFSALGGGMIRDALIGRGTVAAMAEPEYLALACSGALLAYLTNFKGRVWELFQVHADAIVLGAWAVTGCVKALSFDLPILSAIFMGVVTGVGGGMIRDVVTNQVPSIFAGGKLYAIPALISAACMVGFHVAGYDAVGMVVSPIIGSGLAILSYWRGWTVPTDPEWAPVNMTAAQLRQALGVAEEHGRKAARRIEPHQARRMRHAAMERAAARRRKERIAEMGGVDAASMEQPDVATPGTHVDEVLDEDIQAAIDLGLPESQDMQDEIIRAMRAGEWAPGVEAEPDSGVDENSKAGPQPNVD
mgnify:CR=1 FL=1